LEVFCNTDNDTLKRNIVANCALDLPWLDAIPPHDGHAVIVGSGPSAKKELHQIIWRRDHGQNVFALNAAAKWLMSEGVMPAYQVVLDAREENRFFLIDGPRALLASQCHPSLFRSASKHDTTLWHVQDDETIPAIPRNLQQFSTVGGGITVGLSAMCLAYVMGYRKIHLFGYDSSFDNGKTHVVEQPQNRNEDLVTIQFAGMEYETTIPMAAQAENFATVRNSLISLGCVITIDGYGLLPAMERAHARRVLSEQRKYVEMWSVPAYRDHSPGEMCAQRFIEIAGPKPGDIVLDLGCGTGRGGLKVKELTGCEVVFVDFADNCLDDREAAFIQADLSTKVPLRGNYAYCCDVLEHIPPEQVDDVLTNVCSTANHAFFQVCLAPDEMGVEIGQDLHLSVHPSSWWLDKFSKHGTLRHFEDHGATAVFYLETSDYSE
jgi:uncharacterized Rossmann fold enzyme